MRRVLLVLVVCIVAYFTVTTLLVISWMGKDQHPHADAIVVLGAAQYNGQPSPIYQARLRHAVDLYQAGTAPVVVFTGGNEPGDRFTEGDSGQRWAIAHGVPAEATLVEDSSRTTLGNLQGAKRLLAGHPASHQPPTVVLVSDPFHMFRAVEQARDLGLVAYPSPTRSSPISANPAKLTAAILREDLGIGAYLVSLDR